MAEHFPGGALNRTNAIASTATAKMPPTKSAMIVVELDFEPVGGLICCIGAIGGGPPAGKPIYSASCAAGAGFRGSRL